MPADLKARIDAAAARNGRSINAECVARLQESFEAPASTVPQFVHAGDVDLDALAEAIAAKLEARRKD